MKNKEFLRNDVINLKKIIENQKSSNEEELLINQNNIINEINDTNIQK